MTSYFTGNVQSFNDKSGYGYIRADVNQADSPTALLLVHRFSLRDNTSCPKAGDRVSFATEQVPSGTLAIDVHVVQEEVEDVLPSPLEFYSKVKGSEDLRTLALLARDNKRWDEAARLYAKAIEQQPNVGLILSFRRDGKESKSS